MLGNNCIIGGYDFILSKFCPVEPACHSIEISDERANVRFMSGSVFKLAEFFIVKSVTQNNNRSLATRNSTGQQADGNNLLHELVLHPGYLVVGVGTLCSEIELDFRLGA